MGCNGGGWVDGCVLSRVVNNEEERESNNSG